MLTKEQIERFLQEINAGLAAQDAYGEIVLCGGAVMALVYNARQSTKRHRCTLCADGRDSKNYS